MCSGWAGWVDSVALSAGVCQRYREVCPSVGDGGVTLGVVFSTMPGGNSDECGVSGLCAAGGGGGL